MGPLVRASTMYSTELIDNADLRRMSEIALADLESLCTRKPRWEVYRRRLVAVALCQGAASHYQDHTHGLKDIDLWSFFAEVRGQPYPWRRIGHADFGPSKFGTDPSDSSYRGRRVDLMGRSLPHTMKADAAAAIKTWLRAGSTSATFIRRSPIVLVYPPARLGEFVWHGDDAQRHFLSRLVAS